MVCIRHRWLVASLALGALAVGAGACKKDEKKADQAAAGGPAGDNAAGGVTAEKPATGSSAAAGDAISMLPKSSEIVIGLNIGQVAQSPLFKKFIEPQLATKRAEISQKIGDFKAKCGFDPVEAVLGGTVVMGVSGVDENNAEAIIVVTGAPDKAKVMDCIGKVKDEAAKNGSEVTIDGDFVMVKNKDENQGMVATYANPSTMVIATSKNPTKEALQAAIAGTNSLKSSDAFMQYYGKLNTKHTMWMVVNGKGKMFDQVAAMGGKPQFLYGSINVTDGIAMDFRMRFQTADVATQVAKAVDGQVNMVRGMAGGNIKELKVTSEGDEVKTTVLLTAQNIEALAKQFGGMLGAHGGGM
ncbi:MAG: hypothetical protein AB7P03_09240 [Kofleriaceae bacterium]